MKINKAIVLGLILGAIFALILLLTESKKIVSNPVCRINYCPAIEMVVEKELVRAETTLRGIASHYNSAGCLGCSADLTMANGERLIDSALTLALTPSVVRRYGLLNQFVTVTNMINGKSVSAKVTDTGGFGKYNRVADLTDGTRDAIGCSGLCEVTINF